MILMLCLLFINYHFRGGVLIFFRLPAEIERKNQKYYGLPYAHRYDFLFAIT